MRINYNSSTPTNGNGRGGNNMAKYGDLMLRPTAPASSRNYLNTEESFRVLKDLEQRNLFVPVVGNFAGPKALRAVGKYVRDHGATVTALYLSNVEQYLNQDGIWGNFCANVASMPLDAKSTFIRSARAAAGARAAAARNYSGPCRAKRAGCGRRGRTASNDGSDP